MAKYGVLVYSKGGVLLGDIRHLARNLKWSEQRNQPETVSFDMDLAKYEDYVSRIGMSPYDFMDADQTDIRIVRDGVARIGAQLIKFSYSPDDPSIKVELYFDGYLNYFKDAYVNAAYTAQTQGDILWGVINQHQSKDYANFGITRGPLSSTGPFTRDRNQTRANVKDFMIRLSNVIGGPDFKFTPDKKFNSYDMLGTYRPDIKLIYPLNVDDFGFSRSADSLANFIYGIGSGNGDDAVQATTSDTTSMSGRYRREKVATFNSVEKQTTLQENINGLLALTKDVRELPRFTMHDGILDLNDLFAGDTVYAEIQGYASLSHVHGYYRIEKIECDVDDNDAETPSLTFDDLNIDDVIAQQDTE